MPQNKSPKPSLSQRLSGTIGFQVFIGFFPNVLFSFVLLFVSQAVDRSHADHERQAALIGETLQSASDLALELYPPGGAPARDRNPNKVRAALKKFEGLYWGRLGLLAPSQSERCLAELHLDFLQAAEGGDVSPDPNRSRQRIELKIRAIADALRGSYNETDGKHPAGGLGDTATGGACGG